MSDFDYLKAKCQQFGNHFFDADTMDFFNSRIEKVIRVSPNEYRLITSEIMDDSYPRRFTVRHFTIDQAAGKVDDDNVSAFMEYDTFMNAKAHLMDRI